MARKRAHELVSLLASAVLIVIAVAAFTTTTTCSAARSVDGPLKLPLSSEGMGSSSKGRSTRAGSGLEYCYNCVCYPWKPYDCECRDFEYSVCNPGCDYCDCDEVDQLCQCRDKFKSCPPQQPNPLFSSDQA